MKVYKFGGASVKDASAVKNVGNVLANFGGDELLVVVSAMGKTTNGLERLAKAYFENKPEKNEIYKEVKQFHDQIIAELLSGSFNHSYDDIENLFIELECELETTPDENFDQVYDQIVSYGEIFSTRIVSTYLNEIGIKNYNQFITEDIIKHIVYTYTNEHGVRKLRENLKDLLMTYNLNHLLKNNKHENFTYPPTNEFLYLIL